MLVKGKEQEKLECYHKLKREFWIIKSCCHLYVFNVFGQWLKTCNWVCIFKHNGHSSEFVIFHLLRFELLARLIIKYLQQKLWIFTGNRLTNICHDLISLTIDTSITCFIIMYCSFKLFKHFQFFPLQGYFYILS